MSQPEDSYTNPINTQPDSSSSSSSASYYSSSSSHSNGSFGPVFAVLAVIVVISAVACVLGRLCGKKLHRGKEAKGHSKNKNKNNSNKAHQENHHSLGPKEWESRQKPNFDVMNDGDIEFGFGKNKKSSNKGGVGGGGGGGANGKMKQQQPPHINYQHHINGGHFKQDPMRYADNV